MPEIDSYYHGAITNVSLYETLLPNRASEFATIQESIGNGVNLSIAGPPESGKSSLLRYCAQTGAGGENGFYRSLQIVSNGTEFIEMFSTIVPPNTKVIYLDEMEQLATDHFPDPGSCFDFILQSSAKHQYVWVIGSHTPIHIILPRLTPVFSKTLTLKPIPLDIRPRFRAH